MIGRAASRGAVAGAVLGLVGTVLVNLEVGVVVLPIALIGAAVTAVYGAGLGAVAGFTTVLVLRRRTSRAWAVTVGALAPAAAVAILGIRNLESSLVLAALVGLVAFGVLWRLTAVGQETAASVAR